MLPRANRLTHSIQRSLVLESRYPDGLGNWGRHCNSSSRTAPIRYVSPLIDKPKAKPNKTRQPYRHRPWFSTLDPKHLTRTDFCDVSGLLTISPFPKFGHGELTKHYLTSADRVNPHVLPFPPQTQGFFYYIQIQPGVLGEVRFRIVPDGDPAGFAAGKDLCSAPDTPWTISTKVIATSAFAEPLHQILLRDGLVTTDMLADARKHFSARYTDHDWEHASLVSGLGQPFPVDFHVKRWPVTVSAGWDRYRCKIANAWGQRDPIFRGSAICCFEGSRLPNDPRSPTLVIRVLKILRPVVPLIPLPPERAADAPKEGALITVAGRPHHIRRFSFSKALQILFDQVEQKARTPV
ncbi:hypothetical protein DENSPDRAFT_286466 [Dentipellis sp. KUC8613]|nr:hypothetical protein DENSPDRAFT_286466 [Dentipellis sp. KUC8613]